MKKKKRVEKVKEGGAQGKALITFFSIIKGFTQGHVVSVLPLSSTIYGDALGANSLARTVAWDALPLLLTRNHENE
jgi:hypothetical protein